MTDVIWIILGIGLSVLLLAVGVRFSLLADRSRVHRFARKRYGTVLALAACQEQRGKHERARFSSYWVAECVDDDDRHHRIRCRCGFLKCELLEHEELDEIHQVVRTSQS